MQLKAPDADRVLNEHELYAELLQLDGKNIVELGCGTAIHTERLAGADRGRTVMAFDVDTVQIERHQQRTDLPGVSFELGGAESIALPDASADVVCMFKSLHHVPLAALDTALDEIARVLKQGGLAYISEPVFAGEFNEIIRLFNDEEVVREAAFEAVKRAVDAGHLELVEEIFFLTPSRFTDFSDFEQRILGATHLDLALSPTTLAEIKARFEACQAADGSAEYQVPMRVDLLRKP